MKKHQHMLIKMKPKDISYAINLPVIYTRRLFASKAVSADPATNHSC